MAIAVETKELWLEAAGLLEEAALRDPGRSAREFHVEAAQTILLRIMKMTKDNAEYNRAMAVDDVLEEGLAEGSELVEAALESANRIRLYFD